ncbi:MAG: aminotransferase class I/II-fold pyridoxal phosphate-dependent enzyme [Lachnospiraceae bacterium]|nr:aminotransferase class I/II-fold pyridoxal phosphate-dependent enzyme [Lachnospiraceae bacterium]
MQAVVLAAGMGKRLKNLTKNNTKCMVKVNGRTLIERMLHQLEKYKLTSIIIITGYEGEKLKNYVESLNIETPILYIENQRYEKTNNIYSLSLAKEYLKKEDTLIFESDIIFEDEVLDILINDSRQTLALVDRYESWMDGTCVRLDDEDRIVDFISGRNFDFNNTMGCFKTVNIYKFSKSFSEKYYVPFLEAYLRALGENEYYEQVLKVIASLDNAKIRGKRLNGQKWYEIDDKQDLDIAEAIFASDIEDMVLRIEERYGGYWRFSNLMDFCYLVNPYYPPRKMKDEIRASFDRLISEYPSGMQINSMLASKNFDINEDNIVVGNGAAELIKTMVESLDGKMGVIRPTFEEYPNRYDTDKLEIFYPANDDFSYSADDIIHYYDKSDINSIIVINPDNPSGNYINKKGIFNLIKWSKDKGINLIIDESFADFADEKNNSLFQQDLLDENQQLYVIKSISKSYGVPGLRLGVMASGNQSKIKEIKKRVSIWNINSFAEFYMQIQGKYANDYYIALDEFRNERKRFADALKSIQGLRLIFSQANYFMLEIMAGISARELTRRLLKDYNILIKDLTDKVGSQYIRIAIRNKEDNDKLFFALGALMER